MSNTKINKKYLGNLPILLVIDIPNEVNLQFLDFVQASRQFKIDEKSKVAYPCQRSEEIN